MACKKNCNEVNVPEVDNTNKKCTDCGFLDIECVISEEAIPYLGTLADDDLKTIIEKLIEQIQSLKEEGSFLSKVKDEAAPFYALTLPDAGYYIRYITPITELVVEIPENSTVPFPIGTVIEFAKISTGDIRITAASPNVTFTASGALLTSMTTTARLIKVDTDVWDVIGDLT